VCLAECEKFRAANRFGPFGLSDIQQALKGKRSSTFSDEIGVASADLDWLEQGKTKDGGQT
jgi:hypothetical protein